MDVTSEKFRKILLSNSTRNTMHFRPTCSSSNSPPSRAIMFILMIGVTSLSIVPSTYTVPSLLLILIGESVCNMVNWTWNGKVPSDKWMALAYKLYMWIFDNNYTEHVNRKLTSLFNPISASEASTSPILAILYEPNTKRNISFELKSGLYSTVQTCTAVGNVSLLPYLR